MGVYVAWGLDVGAAHLDKLYGGLFAGMGRIGHALAFHNPARCECRTALHPPFGRTLEVDGPSNLYAQVSVGLHYWEIEHDMEKTYQYLSSLMTATPWIAEWYGRCAPYLMEAAYATGRREEAEDAGIWLEKWDRRQRQRMRQEGDFIHETTINALFGETIRLINTEGQLEIAKEAHARLKRLAPRHHLTLEIAWQIAKREGDAIAISNALENCVLTEGDSYSQNRWAAREIARYRR